MTSIEWTSETWNPVVGCSRVSDGCRNCYAERQAFRNEATAWALLNALRDQRPFYCHAGWAAIATFGPDRDAAVEKLARRASERAGSMPA